MQRRIAVGVAGMLVLALAIGAGVLGRAKPPPNVLFIMWDTARADRMSLYGHGRPTTPRLDAFARNAVVYERAIAPGMWTLNSHAAMFTGLYETSHGATPTHRWLDGHYETLAEQATGAGYDTFFYSSNLIASPMTNLTQGFETVHTAFPRQGAEKGRYTRQARRATRDKLLPNDASTEISPGFVGSDADEWAKAVFKDSAPVAHEALMDWLGERISSEKPFLAYLNLMEAHTPRVPSASARRRVADEATIALALQTDASLFAANAYIVGQREYSPGELAAMAATYDAALVDLDDATGDLLDDLSARGLLDNTVVVIVSDHGEGLGEHRRLEHRWSMYEQLLHVPLIVHYPKKLAPGRIADRVNTLDLHATLLELMGLSPPAGTASRSLVGRKTFEPVVFSLMLDPFASQLKTVKDTWPDLDVSAFARTVCVAYEGAHKLMLASDGAHALYDLVNDPAELVNLLSAEVDAGRRLTAALDTFEEGLPMYDPDRRSPEDGADGSSREERARLAALGYLVDDLPPEEALALKCGARGKRQEGGP